MSSQVLLFLSPLLELVQDIDPAATGTPGEEAAGGGGSILFPMIAIMAIFYFVLIAPERKKQKKRDEMLQTMKKGERVMTTSGLFGTVVQVKEDVVTLQVAENVRLRFSKSAVQSLLDREETKDSKDSKESQESLPEAKDAEMQETT